MRAFVLFLVLVSGACAQDVTFTVRLTAERFAALDAQAAAEGLPGPATLLGAQFQRHADAMADEVLGRALLAVKAAEAAKAPEARPVSAAVLAAVIQAKAKAEADYAAAKAKADADRAKLEAEASARAAEEAAALGN